MRIRLVLVIASCVLPSAAAAAELKPETVKAYEAYIAKLEQGFSPEGGDLWLRHIPPGIREQLQRDEILVRPGREDGIVKVPDGLVHHWRAAVFVPGTSLADLLAVAQDYGSYADVYDWIVASRSLGRESAPGTRVDRYRALLRIRRSASVVTSTVDVWTEIEYRYPEMGLVTAVSNADCIRQVEDAGEPDERRLPVGQGSGYLWRANTYTTYLERDGGVYVDLQTIGLSRRFPPLLGWLIEPIARRLGRGSAAQSLDRLRAAVAVAGREAVTPTKPVPAGASVEWCGEPAGEPALVLTGAINYRASSRRPAGCGARPRPPSATPVPARLFAGGSSPPARCVTPGPRLASGVRTRRLRH